MPQIGSPKGEHGKNSCRGGNCWEKAEFSLVAVQGIVGCEWAEKDCFAPSETEETWKHGHKKHRLDQTKQN